MKETKSLERYQRQVLLKEFGEAGQQKLLRAKVVVIGAGGLGCPVLQYLVAAGVGTIGIVDDDTVSLTNLHRQPLYTVKDIGLSKAELAASGLRQLNPDINIIQYNQRLTVENALDILESFDIIVDGTDNFSTRYLINDACVLLDKPLVYGAISQFEGQVAVFNVRPDSTIQGVNYRDLFPVPPKEDEVLNCAQAGVLGVLPGIIGTMMANETIKLITGIGNVLANQLFTYNALTNQVYQWTLTPGTWTASLIPANKEAFKKMDYLWLCGSTTEVPEIDSNEFDELRENKVVDIIDVRELDELPEVNEFYHLRIPLKQIGESTPAIEAETVVVFCQSGMRSKKAVALLSGIFGDTKKIYSLKGGIVNWKNQQHSQQI